MYTTNNVTILSSERSVGIYAPNKQELLFLLLLNYAYNMWNKFGPALGMAHFATLSLD